MSSSSILRPFAFLGLAALAIVVFMGKSEHTSLQAMDSTNHAMLALNVTSGFSDSDYKPVLPIPRFTTNHQPEATFNDHPFPLFYFSGLIMRAFGPSAWSARLLATLFSVGCVLALAWLGSLLYSPAVGLVAGFILMLSRDFILIGSRFHLDTPMVFFIILSFVAWVKRKPVWMGVAAGLGLWMKSPVALLVFPSVFAMLLMTRAMSKKNIQTLAIGTLTVLGMIALLWTLTGIFGGLDLVSDYWVRQVWGTAIEGRGAQVNLDPWMGWVILKKHYLPWNVLLFFALVVTVIKRRFKTEATALPLAAALIVMVVMTAVKFKFYWYFVPVFPFLALLIVDPVRNWLTHHMQTVFKSFIALGLFVPAFLIATPVSFGPENFPALRRFNPIIQAYGSAKDRVLFVDGGQPWGGVVDTIYEIRFYSGREILEGNCDTANAMIKAHAPEWVMISEGNLKNCVDTKLTSQYPVQYRFGTQVLMSRIIARDEALDLTPLMRDLVPPLEGQSAPILENEYFKNSSGSATEEGTQ